MFCKKTCFRKKCFVKNVCKNNIVHNDSYIANNIVCKNDIVHNDSYMANKNVCKNNIVHNDSYIANKNVCKNNIVHIEGLAQEHAIFTYRDFSGAAFFYLSSLIKHIHDPNLDSLFLLVYFIILNIPHSLIIIITA